MNLLLELENRANAWDSNEMAIACNDPFGSTKREMSKQFAKELRALIDNYKSEKHLNLLRQYINSTPELLSLLYDLDLLPEQCRHKSKDYARCFKIAEWFRLKEAASFPKE